METCSNQTNNDLTAGFNKFMRSHTARFIIVGIISLVLMIPLSQLGHLIDERKSRQNDVTSQLETEWGGPVSYYGMVLKVPVTSVETWYESDSSKAKTPHVDKTEHIAYIYPELSSESINSAVTEKYFGIFSSPTFKAEINGNARFNLSAFLKNDPTKEINWSKAQLGFITDRDARFKEITDVNCLGKKHAIEQQEQLAGDHDFLINSTEPFLIDPTTDAIFEVQMNTSINGSQSIHYEPLAAKSTLKMTSNWSDPSFEGTSHPNGNSLKITKNGFSADWTNIEIGGGKSKLHLDQLNNYTKTYSDIHFLKLVDQYQLNERTIKYGLLVLILTFAVFFLIQIVGKLTIHPLHYFMIGMALLLFYSLLLSFSEQIGFIPAYLIAATTIVLLIVWYAKSILKSVRFAVMSGLSLGLLYTFLLVIVNLEIYALIVGSIGLLFVLAAIMSITRKINFEAA